MTKRTTSSILLLAGALFGVPVAVLAAPLDLMTERPQPAEMKSVAVILPSSSRIPNTEAFCATRAETRAKLTAAVETKGQTVDEYIAGLSEDLENERNGRDAKREEARSEADQSRSEGYARLAERADSKNEEDAVKQYGKRIEKAVDDHREAIDEALAEFRSGTDALFAKRRAALQSTRETFTVSVEAAVKELEADCLGGVATATLLSDFKTGLKTARERLATDKKSVVALGTEMKTLVEERRKSFSLAATAFQTELTAANVELMVAFQDR